MAALAARVSTLGIGTSTVVSSSPSVLRRGAGASTFASGQRIAGLVSLPCVQRVARLTVQAKRGEVEPVALEQSIREAWTSLSGNGVARNAAIVAMNVLLTMPALAEEKGKIFDFNLTLPIIAIEFLVLMVALDNIWFKPVAAVMDKRDQDIREKLLGVRDNSGEIQTLQDEAEAIIKGARAETTSALNNMKRETAAALEKNLQESKARIEKELAASLANLEEQKEETMRGLEVQVQALSDEIISKVIPFQV
jgi:F-type H+-transporting ATPase subunit b